MLTVSNTGGGPLDFYATPAAGTDWIQVDPAGTQTLRGGTSLSIAIAPTELLEINLDTALVLHTKLLPGGQVDVPVHFVFTTP